MASLFETTFKERVVPLAQRVFGEEVTLLSDPPETVTALIDEIENVSSEDEQAELRTTIHISEADKSKLTDVAEATIYGERWHILEPFPSRNGLIAVPVRRHLAENTRSQIFGLTTDQQL